MIVDIIGVPLDLGASRRGVDMGPSAVRYAGLKAELNNLGIDSKDLGNIEVPLLESIEENNNTRTKFIKEITAVNSLLSDAVRQSMQRGNFPLVLGGDHSIAAGTILGTQSVRKNIGIIWIDAHGDCNTEETTLSGNLHGMSLAASAGLGVKELTKFKPEEIQYINPEKVVIIGARNLDKEEAELIRRSGITVFSMTDIDMYGMRDVIKKALRIVESDTEGFHLSFDLDALSPDEAPGVGTPVPGGLTYREAHLATEMISTSKKLCSMEFVEVNPILDHRNKTGKLAVSLICSALGKKII
ncbi:MAG: arginase [Clostridia bacterium]|nr:arginase [Clostridia bacterium]